jgi:hypothetical protein
MSDGQEAPLLYFVVHYHEYQDGCAKRHIGYNDTLLAVFKHQRCYINDPCLYRNTDVYGTTDCTELCSGSTLYAISKVRIAVLFEYWQRFTVFEFFGDEHCNS